MISGDLTQRARGWQFAEAADFLKRLPTRALAVPGNHDIPLYHVFKRVFQPLRGYRRYIEAQTEPVYEDSEMIVAGLNSATRWQWKEGRLRNHQVERIRQLLQKAPPSVVKILVMHHPPSSGLRRINHVLGHKPDLVLSGHLHKTDATLHTSGSIMIAAGSATSTRLRGECNTFNVIDVAPPSDGMRGSIGIEVREWNGKGFETRKTSAFQLEPGGWQRQPEPTL